MVCSTMNLISGTHHSFERKEYIFMILRGYTIISPNIDTNKLIYCHICIKRYKYATHDIQTFNVKASIIYFFFHTVVIYALNQILFWDKYRLRMYFINAQRNQPSTCAGPPSKNKSIPLFFQFQDNTAILS